MNNKRVFVTLFNSRYMSRGLVMYESMVNVMTDFILYIIAFDDKAYEKLKELNLKNVEVISLQEFEDEKLLIVKKERTAGEYCWTCSSKSILYILEKYNVEQCTYIDADLYFFSDPTCLLDEMGDEESVLITEHRYSDYCNQAKTSGKYCVQFVTFKNNSEGLKVLKWWTDRCIEWCFSRLEDGKFGDQMYLDHFFELSDEIHELQNIGGGVAPWNASQYTFFTDKQNVLMRKKEDKKAIPVVFYHFHALDFFDKDVVHLTGSSYIIPDTAVTFIYKEYIKMTERVCQKYSLLEERKCWLNEENFRDDDMDNLIHEKNYYHYSLFV